MVVSLVGSLLVVFLPGGGVSGGVTDPLEQFAGLGEGAKGADSQGVQGLNSNNLQLLTLN